MTGRNSKFEKKYIGRYGVFPAEISTYIFRCANYRLIILMSFPQGIATRTNNEFRIFTRMTKKFYVISVNITCIDN